MLAIRKTVAPQFEEENISDPELLRMFYGHASDLSTREPATEKEVSEALGTVIGLAEQSKFNEAFDLYRTCVLHRCFPYPTSVCFTGMFALRRDTPSSRIFRIAVRLPPLPLR